MGALEKRLDEIYADFTGKVARGPQAQAREGREVAKGQIWSGADAKARGLVDELGGLAMAIRLAKQESKLAQETAVTLVTYPSEEERWEEFLGEFMGSSAAAPALSDSAALLPGARELARELQPLIAQPDAVLLWAPPISVNGRLD
jgi:protease-4